MSDKKGGEHTYSSRVLVEKMTTLTNALEKLEKKIENKLVTKDQLNLQISEAMRVLHKEIIDPMQKKVEANEIKANWSLRFAIGTLSAIAMAVLGIVLKANIGI